MTAAGWELDGEPARPWSAWQLIRLSAPRLRMATFQRRQRFGHACGDGAPDMPANTNQLRQASTAAPASAARSLSCGMRIVAVLVCATTRAHMPIRINGCGKQGSSDRRICPHRILCCALGALRRTTTKCLSPWPAVGALSQCSMGPMRPTGSLGSLGSMGAMMERSPTRLARRERREACQRQSTWNAAAPDCLRSPGRFGTGDSP